MIDKITLREATAASHHAAEQTALAQAMIQGTMSLPLYHQFIFNMAQIYSAIETKIPYLPGNVQRSPAYAADLKALDRGSGTMLRITQEYVTYIMNLDVPRAWAHIYVHYLGNMYGGQMLKKNITFPTAHLEFKDIKDCISYVRANISDIDPAEANRAFDWTMKVYDELDRVFGQDSAAV